MYLANFNSIKVQLELITWLLHIKACKFQFHKGTIRTEHLTYNIAHNLISIP